ncbi:MAG: hypothetical protein AB1640_06010 [bacterium]
MKRAGIIAIVGFFFVGCATPATAPKSQLQIREFQTRSYETKDTMMVMKAVLNTLQDEGFIVKNAVPELGLLTATKEMDVEDKTQAILLRLLGGANATWLKNSIVEATANVSDFGSQTRVRLNFQVKTYDNRGAVREVKQIEDAQFYQNFFAKVDKGIFIQKEKL